MLRIGEALTYYFLCGNFFDVLLFALEHSLAVCLWSHHEQCFGCRTERHVHLCRWIRNQVRPNVQSWIFSLIFSTVFVNFFYLLKFAAAQFMSVDIFYFLFHTQLSIHGFFFSPLDHF